MNKSALQKRISLFVALGLAIVTLAVYWQVGSHDFINFDDNEYITENTQVQKGLTQESILWAFTTVHSSNWHPLTWLSHMLDIELFGMDPGGQHLTSVIFHVVNTVLLFFLLHRMTGAPWRSGFVAALFALHPLHVESVAWISERKDVLSTMFWLLTTWAYIRYLERRSIGRYTVVGVCLALGLMAKPMLVTLPFVFLLLDYWPLGRFDTSRIENQKKTDKSRGKARIRLTLLPLVREKIPLFLIVLTSSVVTFLAQRSAGSVQSWDVLPLTTRLANAAYSCYEYIRKMFWPSDLAVFYPHLGGKLPIVGIVTSVVLLILVSGLVLRYSRRRPYLLTGWFWYLGTLVPVLGIVQVGMQSMADRYTYVPLIGLFIILAWFLPDILSGWRYRTGVLAAGAVVNLVALMTLTWTQLSYWKNSKTLFEHALSLTERNFIAHYNLGATLHREGRTEEALNHYREALKINPAYSDALNNLGVSLTEQGRLDEAIGYYNAALRVRPRDPYLHNNLGAVFAQQGNLSEAITHFSEAVRLDPSDAVARTNLEDALKLQKESQPK